MAGQDKVFGDELLYGVECRCKIFRVAHGGSLLAYPTERLGKGRTAQGQSIEREVDVVNGRAGIAHEYGRNDFLHVAHFGSGRNDDGTGRIDFLVAIFLSHREAVFSGGNVDAQITGKLAASLNGPIETGIFAGVLARPHPVGAQRDTVEAIRPAEPIRYWSVPRLPTIPSRRQGRSWQPAGHDLIDVAIPAFPR